MAAGSWSPRGTDCNTHCYAACCGTEEVEAQQKEEVELRRETTPSAQQLRGGLFLSDYSVKDTWQTAVHGVQNIRGTRMKETDEMCYKTLFVIDCSF